MKTGLFLALTAGSATAFTTHTPVGHRASTLSKSSLHMGGASGYATSLEGKKSKVETVQGLLETSEMIFSVPANGVSVAEVQSLRRGVPEGTTISVIKNTLMQKACAGTDYEEATADMLKGANMWFFIEEDIGGSVKAFNAFTKEYAKQESHEIIGGVLEGNAYDKAGVTQISKLPSKIELITKIAGSIKAVPTKLARVIKAPGDKTARAIKLATEEACE
jgi:large subunit ribosomal protein L10